MSILTPTPTTVVQAIAPFKKVAANLKSVAISQKKKAENAQAKIDAACAALTNTSQAQTIVIDDATSEALAATRLLEKLEELLSVDTTPVSEMKPAEKMAAARDLDKKG